MPGFSLISKAASWRHAGPLGVMRMSSVDVLSAVARRRAVTRTLNICFMLVAMPGGEEALSTAAGRLGAALTFSGFVFVTTFGEAVLCGAAVGLRVTRALAGFMWVTGFSCTSVLSLLIARRLRPEIRVMEPDVHIGVRFARGWGKVQVSRRILQAKNNVAVSTTALLAFTRQAGR